MKARAAAAWRHLRAALVLAHVVVLLLFALPNPGVALDRSAWRSPNVQHELEAWSGRLSALGVDVARPQLEERLYRLLVRWGALRAELLAPTELYQRYAGIRQPWTMFAAPNRHPARLELEVEVQGAWQTIYVARSDEHDWQATLLDHDRMRAVVFRHTWPQFAGTHQHLCRWLARRAARDFPEATRLRARRYRARTPTPEEARAGVRPEGRYEQVILLPIPRDPQ